MWAKRKSLKNLFGSNFDYNVMFLAIEELFYLFQLFLSGDFPLRIENVSPDSHLQGIFIYTFIQ